MFQCGQFSQARTYSMPQRQWGYGIGTNYMLPDYASDQRGMVTGIGLPPSYLLACEEEIYTGTARIQDRCFLTGIPTLLSEFDVPLHSDKKE